MQRIIYLSAFLFGFSCFEPCFAQIQLGEEDILRTGNYIYNRGSSISIVPGKSGENQIWDFTNLKTLETESYDITGFKADGSLKDANITESINGTISAYYKKTSNGIYSVTGNTSGGFQNLKFMSLPLVYGQKEIDSAINKSQYTGVSMGMDTLDSVRVTTRITMWSDADAWGSLKIPNAVFNTLRLKIKIITKMDLEGKKAGQSYKLLSAGKWSDTAVYYQWYSPDEGHWVMNYFEKNYVKFKKVEPANLDKSQFSSHFEVLIHQNQTLDLVSHAIATYKLFICDMAGREIANTVILPNQISSNDLSIYAPGIYFLYLVNEDRSESYCRKFVISR